MTTLTLVADNSTAQDRLEAEAQRVYELKLAAERAKEAYEEADREFRADLEDAGLLNEHTKGFGIIRTTIYETRRFNEALAQKVLDQAVKERRVKRSEIDSCYVQKLDPKKLQNVVSPALYDQMQKTSGMTVRYALASESDSAQ